MTPITRFMKALENNGCKPTKTQKGWMALCPAHDDRNPSLSLDEGDDYRVLAKCHAGCSINSICQALGMELSELMPIASNKVGPAKQAKTPSGPKTAKKNSSGPTAYATPEEAIASLENSFGVPDQIWDYYNAEGEIVGKVLRRTEGDGTKDIRPVAKHSNGWIIGGMPEPRPLYRLPDLKDAERVYLCEGEKAADAIRSLGLVATTSAHGSSSAAQTDWSPLAGKECIFLPDNDDPGEKYIREVESILADLSTVPSVRIVRLKELPSAADMPTGGDAADWVAGFEQGTTNAVIAEKLIAIVEAQPTRLASWQWPEIDRFEDRGLPEFPVDCLPKPLRDWVREESHATQTPPELAALLSLAVCSSMIARKVVVEARPGWQEPTNLYVAVLLEPANRKSQVFSDAIRPLKKIEDELRKASEPDVARAESERRQDEAKLKNLERKAITSVEIATRKEAADFSAHLAEQVLPSLPVLVVDDVTSEKLGMLLSQQEGRIASMSAEGGVFDLMKGMYSKSGMPQFGVYLMGHSGDDLMVDRVTRKEIRVERPALTCAYAIQPNVIEGLAEDTAFRGRGLLGRFIYAWPESWLGERKIAPPPVRQTTLEEYEKAVRSLKSNFDGHVLRLSPDADLALQKWEQEIEEMLAEGGEMEQIRDWGGKLAGATLRIAAVIHCLENSFYAPITPQTIERAAAIGSYAIPHAQAVLEEMKAEGKEEHADARYVLRWIERHQKKSFSKRDAQQHGKRRFKKSADIEPALTELKERGYIRALQSERKGPGRPKSEQYEVNPEVFSQSVRPEARYSSAEQGKADFDESIENIENVNGTLNIPEREQITI